LHASHVGRQRRPTSPLAKAARNARRPHSRPCVPSGFVSGRRDGGGDAYASAACAPISVSL